MILAMQQLEPISISRAKRFQQHLQETGRKNGRDPDFPLHRHLKARDQQYWKKQNGKVRHHINCTTCHEHALIIQTATRHRRLPQFLPRNARPYFNGHIRNVEKQVEPDEGMDGVIGGTLAAGNKYPEEE